MRLRIFFTVWTLLALSAAAACTLNPQPLPPNDGFAAADDGADGGMGFGTHDASASNNPEVPPTPLADAASDDDASTSGGEGGTDASDASDAAAPGDGGDAGDDDAG